ncbi:Innexin [Meloidogyne graminicola]|uniref:Innexin n=1 Tax=Meloidogyne graminicola TaxID=189291 RepID=A0A8S9ZMC4_9BILA|nr:Innexin [Meloidogyne graminicola]
MDILIDFISKFIQNKNEDDHFDRLNYQITPLLFVLLAIVNISKLYMGAAINCFTKAEFKNGWVQYTNDYCLWVPFILILQACSFYIPHLLWRSFNWVTGYQIKAVISASASNEQQTFSDNNFNKNNCKIFI